jgi:para-aminobenzoate synthetase component 1
LPPPEIRGDKPMNPPLFQIIPYQRESTHYFEAVADRPWAVWLDSGCPGTQQGRFDIIAAHPMATLVCRGSDTEISTVAGTTGSQADPFRLLRTVLGDPNPAAGEIPFAGGAIGYFGYDLARRLERLPVIARDDVAMAEMAVGIYDWALVVDHQKQQSCLVGQGRDPQTRKQWEQLIRLFSQAPAEAPRPPFRIQGEVTSNLTREQYARAFARIQAYIREGDCYQVNFAQRFTARCEGDPWRAYRTLRAVNPAPFGAYLNLPEGQILCSSPERFLKVTGDEVETRPIKGTRPRAAEPDEDRRLAAELQESAKDRAENLMIVDLLRNDLGKSCEPGSIRVPRLFEVESFASVHHLVSTVTGRLAPGRDPIELLRGCFPGGSITGAPKLRAMEIIEELEPNRRGVYCGVIGYLGFDRRMDTNIAIRTLVHRQGNLYFSAGGGIVADSDLESEYRETFQKVSLLRQMLTGVPGEAELTAETRAGR